MWCARLLLRRLILIGGLVSNVATAAIFDSDDRQFVSTATGSPFSAVGLVSTGSIFGGYMTGTLVDECHVLTSQHILPAEASPIGKRLKFTGALGTTDEVSTHGTVVAAGGYEKYQESNQQYEARAHDWILLRLDTCVGATLGFAALRAFPRGRDDLSHVESAGYPVGRKRRAGLTIDPLCRIRHSYALVWLNDCATLPGNSGGPIFELNTRSGKPQLEVYAIQSAGYYGRRAIPFRAGIENQATPVSAILPYIQPYLITSNAHPTRT